MEKRKCGLKGVSLFIVSVLCLIGSAQAAPIVLRLGNIEAPTNPASIACERMAKMVDERSQGRLKIEFFPASQLGNAITQIEGVMMGSQDMFQGAAEWMGQFEKEYNILALAFAFRDQKHLQAFLNSPINSGDQGRAPEGPRSSDHLRELGSDPQGPSGQETCLLS